MHHKHTENQSKFNLTVKLNIYQWKCIKTELQEWIKEKYSNTGLTGMKNVFMSTLITVLKS